MLVTFAHAALSSPTITTLQKAIDKNFLVDIPGLTSHTLRTYPPTSAATIKGHLDQIRQNINPTPIKPQEDLTLPTLEIADCNQPIQEDPIHQCFVSLHHISKPLQGQVYSDQTGKFSVTSSKGNNYVLILYDYDSNSIHAHPLKTKAATEMVTVFTKLYNTLIAAGIRPKLQRLDNECSALLKQFMTSENVKIQLIPPGIHRANSAERAIRAFKSHFIAGLCSADPQFNLLRASRINPFISAYCQVFGQYMYATQPIAPPGCHVMVHQKPGNRTSWGPHAQDAWYLGPAAYHHRCFRVWIWETRSERVSDTISWLPTAIPTPQYNVMDQILAETQQLVKLLQTVPNAPTHPLHTEPTHSQSLPKIAELLGTVTPPSIPPPPHWPTIPINTHVDVTETAVTPNDIQGNPDPAERLRVPNILPPAPVQPLGTIFNNRNERRSQRPTVPSTKLRETIFTCHHSHQLTEDSPLPYMGSAINCDSGAPTEYTQLLRTSEGHLWEHSAVEEWARLAQGCPPHKISIAEGTNTIQFIKFHNIPKDRKATYPRIVVANLPQKTYSRRVRITVGGDRIEYPGQVATKTAGMTTVKPLLNSVISTRSARFMSINIKDFYLNTPMERAEYMRVDYKLLPKAITDHYHLQPMQHNGGIYVMIVKGMYGLPQAGILANNDLVNTYKSTATINANILLAYSLMQYGPSLSASSSTTFGVRYTGKENAQHLIDTLKLQYSITADWTGSLYIGLTIQWHYSNKTVHISMPNYVTKALNRFGHTPSSKPQHAPHAWAAPIYGAKVQYAQETDDTPLLSSQQIKRLQQIIGFFLYYARAVDSTMLVALGSLAAEQTTATQKTNLAVTQFLDYAATHPEATVRYHASDMILHIHSDASYLSESRGRSRAGSIFFHADNITPTTLNGAIHIISVIMTRVLASAAEAEVAALFFNTQEACPLRQMLLTLNHPQPPTPMTTDNNCASGILNNTVKQKRSKSINMQFYWLRDCIQLKQYWVLWAPGKTSKADYFTKHHSSKHHQLQRSIYLLPSATSLSKDLS